MSKPSEFHTRISPDGSPYVYPILTPRFAISTTDRLIASVGKLAASDPSLAIQTHISENPSEISRTKKLFSHLSTEAKPITYPGVYDHHGLLRDNTILAHAIHLDEEELELVRERRSGISHCPTSNFNLTSGVARVGLMLDKGIKVGPPAIHTLPSLQHPHRSALAPTSLAGSLLRSSRPSDTLQSPPKSWP